MMRLMFTPGAAAVLAGALARAADGTDASGFPFVIPLDGGAPSAVDASSLNPAPLDESRRLTIRDGRFHDATGRRVRFLGVDVTSSSCFPPKERAEAVAARMHRFGINCVRLHHMDAGWSVPGIFKAGGESYGMRTDRLDPESLDRLDWFVWQLKQHGIYVDVNLHVSRQFTAADGFDDTERLPELGKVAGYFVPKMIERQRLYARQLLGHVNPYTGTRFCDDPVVAFIELTNEDSLLGSSGEALALPAPYRKILSDGWNAFLRRRYATTAALLAAWNREAIPLGENLLRNPRFLEGTSGWELETHAPGSAATMTAGRASPGPGAPPGKSLTVGGIKLDGTDWHLQLHQTGLDLANGTRYTLSFAARAAGDRHVSVGARLNRDPWRMIGLETGAGLTASWKRYAYTFVASGAVPRESRIEWMFGDRDTGFEVADVSLRPGGGQVEPAPGESLERGTMDMPGVSAGAAGRDFTEYLMGLEREFAQGMRAYLHGELGARAGVLCSQASYGGLGGAWREAQLDLVDDHAYWQHPGFPRKAWDMNDYDIGNTAMVRDEGGGTLSDLAQFRVAGKPFTVSEYDHPAPSEWAAEAVPMVFSYAAWQDWDGVFMFCYDDAADAGRDRVNGFFDQAAHPGKLGFFPAAARMLLGGAVGPAPGGQTLVVPEARVAGLAAGGGIGELRDRRALLARRAALRFEPGDGATRLEEAGGPPGDTRLEWTSSPAARANYTVDAPAAKVAVGFLGGRAVELKGFAVRVEPTPRNFASIVLVSLDGRPTGDSRRLLLTAVDKAENAGLAWNAGRTFAAGSWDRGPVLAWTPPAEIRLATGAKRVAVYGLDPAGARAGEVPVTLRDGAASFRLGGAPRSLWYEIETIF